MRYTIQIEGRQFIVEIEDLDARPVRVRVEGEWLDVWPECEPETERAGDPAVPVGAVKSAPPAVKPIGSRRTDNDRLVRAPIPGTIVSIAVQAGKQVITGQELVVLEAMKMKNTIRSPRPGQIAAIHVSLGQTVNHQEILVEFAE